MSIKLVAGACTQCRRLSANVAWKAQETPALGRLRADVFRGSAADSACLDHYVQARFVASFPGGLGVRPAYLDWPSQRKLTILGVSRADTGVRASSRAETPGFRAGGCVLG